MYKEQGSSGGSGGSGSSAEVVSFPGFRAALHAAAAEAAEAAEASGEDGAAEGGGEFVDYESMETPALVAMCTERGITSPPPMKRLIIEELRFFDEHGRPGKRNKRTRQLE